MPDASMGPTMDILNDKKNKSSDQAKILVLFIAAIFLGVGAGYSYYKYAQNTSQVRQQMTYVSDIKRLTEKVEKNAYLAQSAKKSAFTELADSSNAIDKTLEVLSKGGKVNDLDTEIQGIAAVGRNDFERTKQSWNANKALLNTLLAQGTNLVELRTLVEKAGENNQKLIDSAFSLQRSVSRLNNPRYDNIAQELLIVANKISGMNTALFSGENFTLTNGYALVKDVGAVSSYLTLLRTGSEVYDIAPITDPAVLEQIRAFETSFSSYSTILSKITENVSVLNSAKELAKTIATEAAQINKDTSSLDNAFKAQLDSDFVYLIAFFILITMLAASIAALGLIFYRERNKALKYAGQLKKNQANEAAVDNLLRQMTPIEEGDLTRPIAVGDKFIDPIANRVDQTREVLRKIISRIKTASEHLDQSAQAANSLSGEVLKASEEQFLVMESSVDSIGNITSEMDSVAQSSWFAKEDAAKAEQVSQQGLITVNSSIEKMNQIRDNIQESSKKIKRLGESSQEIANVTDLIRTITKEINVLAFNAAIQATRAGEGGKAFSIMAQQVQRLAESSAEASHTIDELIKNIQQDTAVAVAAMEQTTLQVVDGTKLNDEAGRILKEIATFSEKLSTDIASVAESIEEKSSDLVKVSLQVRELQSVNNRSMSRVQESVQQVENITQSSSELANYVHDYKVE